MPHAHPTPLLGFSPPFVKDGDVCVQIRTLGGLTEISGTKDLMGALGRALFAVAKRAPAQRRARCAHRGRHTPQPYLDVLAAIESNPDTICVAELCRAHRVEPRLFYNWRAQQRYQQRIRG